MRAQGFDRDEPGVASGCDGRIFVYGSTKAVWTGFYLGVAEALREYGVCVLVIRPGQVRGLMSAPQGSSIDRRQGSTSPTSR